VVDRASFDTLQDEAKPPKGQVDQGFPTSSWEGYDYRMSTFY
jgi:hypothetical protein